MSISHDSQVKKRFIARFGGMTTEHLSLIVY